MLIGREKERNQLEEMMRDDSSHFVAIYGRRRIGKTFLVRETFDYRFTFQHVGLSEGSLRDQLYAFESSIRDAGVETGKKAKNWLEAFEKLKEVIRVSSEKKKVIFIDELSWMDTPRSDLLVALENFWNGWASARKDIILIVSASATSWMLSNVIHNKGGLYNRITERLRIEEFSLGECEKFAREKGLSFNRIQLMQYYMVFGGVPYYWTFLKKGYSIAQNIDMALFGPEAPLKDEFKYLYASIFRHPEVYIRIIETLSKKKVGMTREEIIEQARIVNSGDLTKKLEELESCGFVRKYNAFGMKKKNSVYQLVDFFTLFYYRFLAQEPSDPHFWSSQINTPVVNTWLGLAFERICLKHAEKIKQKLGISGVYCEMNSWSCRADSEKGVKGSQIDLLIVRKDQVINMCEMKYSATDYTVDDQTEKDVRNKMSDLVIETGTKHAIFPTLITTCGMVHNSHSDVFQSVVIADDLF